jgi:hypothetical protein
MKIPAAVNAADMSRGGSEKIKDRRPSPSTRFPTAFLRLHAQKILTISKKASKVEAWFGKRPVAGRKQRLHCQGLHDIGGLRTQLMTRGRVPTRPMNVDKAAMR